MSESTFPPTGPTSLQGILPAYVFQEYADDVDIQAIFASFNGIAQQYQNWFNQINLPIYTQQTGSVLDWVAQGIYGLVRPALQSGQIIGRGLLNTYMLNTLMLNSFVTSGSIQSFAVNDDVFKRIITWHFFKGDRFQLSIPWLKRRIMRFLIGTNGSAPNIDNTYPISLALGSSNSIIITITPTTSAGIPLAIAQIFQAAVQSAVIALPFQYAFSVIVDNSSAITGLANVGGVLQAVDTAGWPTSAAGLPDGAVWDAGAGAVYVIPGSTPNPMALPLIYGTIISAQLLAIGGENLPTTDPVNPNQLWNNAGIVCVSFG